MIRLDVALTLNPNLILSIWPDDDEGIGYLKDSGDIHLLSSQAKRILETLVEKPLTAAQIYEEMDDSIGRKTDQTFNNCIPHLINLGLICQST
ncbi:hypothetical protein G8770_03990 [Aestuariicella hydrocarbonica]|uniref:Uncharacterized protein n=1 Tax=Pseudomaricurvus hydrocarbonicus TaxID=1470433 RepID=A0A9E5JTR0_9GAMM|nr:hypothetical protein [Aestuariicella hydrocarbonica]NHO64705.1 hypothetical protein [Aestuariicella hydrocarbonica]